MFEIQDRKGNPYILRLEAVMESSAYGKFLSTNKSRCLKFFLKIFLSSIYLLYQSSIQPSIHLPTCLSSIHLKFRCSLSEYSTQGVTINHCQLSVSWLCLSQDLSSQSICNIQTFNKYISKAQRQEPSTNTLGRGFTKAFPLCHTQKIIKFTWHSGVDWIWGHLYIRSLEKRFISFSDKTNRV